MANFYSPPETRTGDTILVRGDEAHHICRVLRKRPGERIVVVDGEGNEFKCAIRTCRAKSVEVRVLSMRRKPKEPVLKVTVACAVPRGDRMDSLVEKVTELGVCRVIPLLTERSMVSSVGKEKFARWKRIAVAAVKQSERSVVPRIDEMVSLDELEEDLRSYAWGVVGWELSKRRLVESVFPPEPINDLIVIVGPEGGFTEEEIERLRKRGVVDVWLGERKLRSETASVVLVTLILNHYGDL
jgi:16S rRNA (uracil1498-N3)-methyltransferase